MKKLKLVLGFLLLSTPFLNASAALIATNSRSDFNDLAVWPATCTPGLASVATVSTNGVGVTATTTGAINTTTQRNANGSGGCEYDGWYGNFTPGDALVWSRDVQTEQGTGPITLTLSQAVAGIGAQFQTDFFGPFVAQLEVFSGTTSLGFFTAPGDSNFNADNSAVFLGIIDTAGATITSAVFSITTCTFDCADFVINQVSLLQLPEPGTLGLFAVGVLLWGFRSYRGAGTRSGDAAAV